LVTGGAIAGIGHWGWFDFGNHPTVAIKQCVYLLLLILGGAVMMPLSKKAKKMLGEEMSGSYSGTTASPDLRALVERIGGIGTVMGILVLINIILGVWTNKGVWF